MWRPVAAALTLFAAWVAATWLLEGRIDTLLRPEAIGERVLYAFIANLVIGTAMALAVLRLVVRGSAGARRRAGFGTRAPSAPALAIAIVLGLGFYAVQGAPALHWAVLVNAFSQVLVVSVAEVIVCWSVVGATVERAAEGRVRLGWLVGAAAASVLFGLYHLAHSPPFNTLPMVALLTAVGMVTSMFFFVSRDVYATILFHNFLAMFGVLRALEEAGRLSRLESIQPALLAMAVVSTAVLALLDWRLLRR